MKELKPEYQRLADNYRHEHGSSGCSCHISPPCSSCVHPGNPANLAEDDDAWTEYVTSVVSARRAKHLRKRGKDVYWNGEFDCWVYTREVQHG